MKVSREFLIRLKLNSKPAYTIAQQAGVHPNWLSKAIHGVEPIKPRDPRIVAVGHILGLLESQCFDVAGEEQSDTRKSFRTSSPPSKSS